MLIVDLEMKQRHGATKSMHRYYTVYPPLADSGSFMLNVFQSQFHCDSYIPPAVQVSSHWASVYVQYSDERFIGWSI